MATPEQLLKAPDKSTTVVFTQEGEHIHSWETSVNNLEISRMVESALCTGLVDTSKSLDFIAYDDDAPDEVESVLLEGSIRPALLIS